MNSPRTSAANDASFQGLILLLATGTLILAACLRIEQGSAVLLPGLSRALPEICTSKRLFGWSCPGCGLTRSFISLAHGEWLAAWQYNPAGPLFFALFAVQIPYRLGQLRRLRLGKPGWELGPWSHLPLLCCFVVMVGQWLVRLLEV